MTSSPPLFLRFIALVLVIGAPAAHRAEAAEESATLTIRIEGATSRDGELSVGVFDSEKSFLRQPVRQQSLAVGEDLTAVVSFADMPYGQYAVSVTHDANGNGKFDRSLLGKPKKPYGMSNGAKGRFGPPKYRDARFEVTEPEVTITIRLE